VAVARGTEIDVDDLPEEVLAAPAAASAFEGSVAAARERAEREMIIAALSRNNGEVTSAAREMQVSRTTMWRLMKKHGI
jgi:transcriptional regulator of acetoin/glycerol metabolism